MTPKSIAIAVVAFFATASSYFDDPTDNRPWMGCEDLYSSDAQPVLDPLKGQLCTYDPKHQTLDVTFTTEMGRNYTLDYVGMAAQGEFLSAQAGLSFFASVHVLTDLDSCQRPIRQVPRWMRSLSAPLG